MRDWIKGFVTWLAEKQQHLQEMSEYHKAIGRGENPKKLERKKK